jgi:hypothetical protein
MTNHRVCNKGSTMGDTSGAGYPYPIGAPEFNTGFCVIESLVFCVVLWRPMFVFWFFLFFFELRLTVTTFVSEIFCCFLSNSKCRVLLFNVCVCYVYILKM